MTTPAKSKVVWDMAMKIAVVVVIAVGTATFTHEVRLASNEVRLASIESSRFTDQDARDLEDRISEGYPLKWLMEDVKEIKDLLKVISVDVISLDKKLSSLEARVRILEKK